MKKSTRVMLILRDLKRCCDSCTEATALFRCMQRAAIGSTDLMEPFLGEYRFLRFDLDLDVDEYCIGTLDYTVAFVKSRVADAKDIRSVPSLVALLSSLFEELAGVEYPDRTCVVCEEAEMRMCIGAYSRSVQDYCPECGHSSEFLGVGEPVERIPRSFQRPTRS